MATQAEMNPYLFSDTNKRYLTFDYFVRHRFGKKCAKVPLDAGLTCPNIDGTKGYGGCIYCSHGSSGAVGKTLDEQYSNGMTVMKKKWGDECGFIPYLQAHTNTYGPDDEISSIIRRVSTFEGAVMVAIATRADCLSPYIIETIRDLSEEIPVMLEFGLQTANDTTAELINRCCSYQEFEHDWEVLESNISNSRNIYTCIHIIDGLPGEEYRDMIDTAKKVTLLSPDMVKIHLQYVARGTVLEKMYEKGEYVPMETCEFVGTVCDQLEILPKEMIIARIGGDAEKEELIAPVWSRKKLVTENEVDKELFRRSSFQGCKNSE